MGDAVLLMFPALIVLIALGIPIAFSMVLVASVFGFIRFEEIVFRQFAQRVDEVASNYVLGAIPLFIFMASMLERAGLIDENSPGALSKADSMFATRKAPWTVVDF